MRVVNWHHPLFLRSFREWPRRSSPRRLFLIFVYLSSLAFGLIAQRASAYYVLSDLPSEFDTSYQSLTVQAMGGACLAQTQVLDGMPCAASFLALVKKPRFFGTGLVGNGYEAVKATNDILYKPMSKADLESLFANKSHLEASGSVKFTFLAPHFAAQFSPYQASLQSVVRNASYPVIGIHGINERRLGFSYGQERWKNVLVGTHFRLFQRRFVHQEVQLFQAITNSGAIIKPFEQNGFAFDPSLTYFASDQSQFRWTVALENLGWVDKSFAELPMQPRFVTGIGNSAPVGVGLWEWGVDWRPGSQARLTSEDLSLGSSYRLGALQFLAGINKTMLSGGVRFALRTVDLSVAYTTTRYPSGSSDDYQQSLLTQFGVGF